MRLSLLLLAGLGCLHPGDALEAACIKGRVSEVQASALNGAEWQRRPGYCAGETYTDDSGRRQEGGSDCTVRPGDRVLSASCATARDALFSARKAARARLQGAVADGHRARGPTVPCARRDRHARAAGRVPGSMGR